LQPASLVVISTVGCAALIKENAMHFLLLPLLAVVSALSPAREWVPPAQPLTINVHAEGASKLVLMDFNGTVIDPKTPADVTGDKSVNLKEIYDQVSRPGTYVLYVVPKDKPTAQFSGTPLVIEVRSEQRRGGPAEPVVTKIIPLEYVVMTTEQGPMTMAMYYDVAPITVASFLHLARTGYYDGLTFHRIIPSFVIQGGDPRGDGTGGPGYTVQAEFNDKKHDPGVLSMARQGDPNEGSGAMPRSEYANSAGSQFFICLDYTRTQHLDHRYTAFGKVVSGMDTVEKIAKTPIANEQTGTPQKPPVIQKAEVKKVTAEENPYAAMLGLKK
jgi:cyclophilin family peptidyl-prolyl cis-trans isomerase